MGAGAPITVNFQNNHFINYPSNSISAVLNGSAAANDGGNELWQSESTANAQGYTESNGYAPSADCGSSTCSTIGAGNNNHTLVSAVTPSTLAYGSGTSAGVVEVSYGGGYGVDSPATTMNMHNQRQGPAPSEPLDAGTREPINSHPPPPRDSQTLQRVCPARFNRASYC